MSYEVYDPCEEEIVEPLCDRCVTDRELGRVRSICYVHKSYYATLMTDPTNPIIWQTGLSQKLIMIIPETQGSFDGGSPIEVPGFGDQESAVTGYKFVLNYKDPKFKGNAPHYNSMLSSSKWHVGWRTETLTRISGSVATFVPKSPTPEDINGQVVWDTDAKWSQEKHPVPFDTPEGVFECTNFQ